MTKTAEQVELEKLKQRLEDLREKRRRKKKILDDLTDVLDKIAEKYRQMEEGLQHSYNQVFQKLERLPKHCKFRVRYAEEVKKRLFDTNSMGALSDVQEASRQGKKRLLSVEDELEQLDAKIRDTEERIAYLNKKISEEAPS